jgi:hypothetical protein
MTWSGNGWEAVKEALAMYTRIHGDMTVLQSFVVPKGEEWPEQTWGVNLGTTVNSIWSSNYFVGARSGAEAVVG